MSCVPTLTPEANGDDYYYHLLMLNLPLCNETVDLFGSHSMANQSFVSNKDHLLVFDGEQAFLLQKLNQLPVN